MKHMKSKSCQIERFKFMHKFVLQSWARIIAARAAAGGSCPDTPQQSCESCESCDASQQEQSAQIVEQVPTIFHLHSNRLDLIQIRMAVHSISRPKDCSPFPLSAGLLQWQTPYHRSGCERIHNREIRARRRKLRRVCH